MLTLGVLGLVGVGAFMVMRTRNASAAAAATRPGRLTIDSRPAGADIFVDGHPHGATPQTMSLAMGTHTITVYRDTNARTVPLQLAAGAEVQQYFDFTSSDSAIVATGQISVVTNPSKAQISVDGRARGTSPLTIEDLSPGEHRVAVTGEMGSAERTVTVDRGGTASVVFSLANTLTPMAAGWLSVSAPFESQILEDNELLGTSGVSKIMLRAGRHDITLLNQALGYRENRKADVVAGKVTTVTVLPPKAALSANARPWADVSIDGKVLGQTPVANVDVAIGTHEILFRHPQLGERRETVVVTIKGPNRVSADLTK